MARSIGISIEVTQGNIQQCREVCESIREYAKSIRKSSENSMNILKGIKGKGK